jgi:hypothetical protein
MLFFNFGMALPSLFSGFAGLLDGTGSAAPSLFVPADPALSGLYLWAACVALDAVQGRLVVSHGIQTQLVP